MRFILIFIIFTLQCITLSDSQGIDLPPTGSVDPSPNPNPNPSPTPTQNPVPSDKPTQPSSDPTTNNPPPTTSTQAPNPQTTATDKPQQTTDDNNGNNNPVPTKSNGNNNSNNNNQPTNNNSNGSQPTNSDSGTTPNNSKPNDPASSNTNNGSQGNSNKGNGGDGENDNQNTAKIAGGVVGGIVGLALIGGLLTWLNRHGGCASRTKDRRRHDTYNDFNVNNHQDLESNKMGYHHQDNTSSPHINNTNSMVNSNNNNPGASPLSPFQRRLVPATGQTTGYMNLGDDDYSETSSGLMNQNQPVYPATTQPGMYDYSKTEYNSYEMDAWQHQQQQQQHHHQPQQQYYNTAPSPHIQNMAQMKPDTIDHKPNEI